MTEFIDFCFRSCYFGGAEGQRQQSFSSGERGSAKWFIGRCPIFYHNNPLGPRILDVDRATESCASLVSYSLQLLSPNPKMLKNEASMLFNVVHLVAHVALHYMLLLAEVGII